MNLQEKIMRAFYHKEKDFEKVIFNNESEMLAYLVRFLEDTGWNVFQEVSTRHGYCDVVAKRIIDGVEISWGIEGKMACNSEVILQAVRNVDCFDYVSICTPMAPNPIYEEYLEDNGVGVLIIEKQQKSKYHDSGVKASHYMFMPKWWAGEQEYVKGFITGLNQFLRVHRTAPKNAVKHITETHELYKTMSAGAHHSERTTPYKISVFEIEKYLKDNGTVLVDTLLKELKDKLHWHNPKNGISNVVNKWEYKTFEFVKINNKRHIKLKEQNGTDKSI